MRDGPTGVAHMAKSQSREDDLAARTLGQALREGACPTVQGRVLFLKAHPATVDAVDGSRGWTCVQSRRPIASRLESGGHVVLREAPSPSGSFDTVLALPPRQRDEARACLARAVASVRPGGRVLAAMSNLEGARSGERDLGMLMGDIEHFSRSKCRIFGGVVDADRIDRSLLQQWQDLDATRPILDGRYISRPGLFAWNRVDTASALLAEQLPTDLAGAVADLGAGYGYLSVQALERCPGITSMDLYEAEARALEPARQNLARVLARIDCDTPVQAHWHDVTLGLGRRFDVVICNPPFHAGRADRPELGRAFIMAAADALRPGGSLWMVANRHLPYEATLAQGFASVHAVAERDGFKVIHAVKAAGGAG
jgi:16S rRNA (guanine1207-N2)-methyltransferase